MPYDNNEYKKKIFPLEKLKNWFLISRRALPWRENPTPYAVWISEIMLQQTRARVVVPYFERWMQHFPTIEALAKAPIDQVLKMWEGLGYYSRARNLHQAAQDLWQHHAGLLPSNYSELIKIKGIGTYTCGAILSFAFKQKAVAVDGNVLRVISRFLALEEPIDQTSAKKKIENFLHEILPDSESWLITEGLIELGATVCDQDPKCGECPLQSACAGYRHGMQKTLPNKSKKIKSTPLFRIVAVIYCEGKVLLKRAEKGKIMADLYEFPYLDREENQDVKKSFEEDLGIPLEYVQALPEEKQSFTRFRVSLFPYQFYTNKLDNRFLWEEEKSLIKLPFSSGHRRILEKILFEKDP